MINVGGNIGEIYVGSTKIAEAYVGNQLVYRSGTDVLSYDAKVEYITNTGTQIIDTGIDLVEGTTEVKLVFKASFSATNYNNQSLMVACSSPTIGVQVYTYSTNRLVNHTSEKTIALNTKYIVTTVSTATQRSIKINYGAETSKDVSISISDGSRLYLLSSPDYVQQSRSARASYYWFDIYINNVLVREYIPVRVGQVGYFYDKIGGRLYANSGSSSFVLGNDIAYDSKIEYLQSTGTQWIDTGIIPDSTIGFETQVVCSDNTDTYFIGLRNNSSNTRWGAGHSSGGFYWCYGSYQSSGRLTGQSGNIKLNYYNDKKYVATDGSTTSTDTLPTLSFTPGYNIRLFGSAGVSASYSKWSGKIYYVKITQGNELIMDLIPVRIGTVGYMYDKIHGELFGNNGTGSFTLGNDIS